MITLSSDEARNVAAEAYSYLYPLVTMDVTRSQLTDTSVGAIGHAAPNTLAHLREFPDAAFRAVVAPNFDTLYSSAWIDLADGPLLLEVPDSGGRYYLLPMLDMWTDVFAAPGWRTTGTGASRFVIAPPGWTGEAPAGAQVLRATTSVLWMIGRTQTNGPSDYAAVNAFQDGLALTRLDGTAPSPSLRPSVAPVGLDLHREPLAVVNGLDGVTFFGYAARLLAQHPPHATDFSVLARMAALGIVPGAELDAATLDADRVAALNDGAKAALELQHAAVARTGRMENGWTVNAENMGVYGNDYLKRAIVAMVGLGANPAEDAIYPLAVSDAAGEPVVGEKDYVQHFAPDRLPPVKAFWSVTMYDADSFQAPNRLDRYALGDRDPLHRNPDGSIDLYYGPTDPGGERTANWLPAPSGPLRIMLRLYAPGPAVLDGTWAPPALTAV
ncbi:membrane protein [Actinomycetospora sp. NBRC 106375]|uniref:DUF1254 domain-containing protein n=1 Tax=Actinomycetospora sp. NBRC 106375 TaxID=3032207 RepID=UPI0024A47189|nr:DUF1254 domain-containing protein [Actinomycetospora sp. NBRC 106375]GLZ48299.1 membrane protein [Actinomycetospora sp. NBRC 106375]